MFEQFIVPELEICGEEDGAIWYHLDGRDARHHLPRLLSLPTLRVVQYVPTPGEPVLGVPAGKPARQPGVIGQVGRKSMNAHIHTLEALAQLRRTWHDRPA